MFTDNSAVDIYDPVMQQDNSSYSRNIISGDKWDSVWHALANDTDLNYTDKHEPVSMATLITEATSGIYKAITDGWTMSVGFSSGKDSTVVLHLFLMALVRAVRNGTNVSQHHFIQMSNTQVENPEIHYLATNVLGHLQSFIDKHNLPVTILVATPSMTQGWVGRILTGRGLPSWSNSGSRQCTFDLKITPLRKAKARYIKGLPDVCRKKVCLMLGSRDDESSSRAASIARMGGDATSVTHTAEGGELYPIKSWTTQQVWTFLTESGSAKNFLLPSFQENNFAIATLYKDATGECVWSAKPSSKSNGCGSRFGCFSCQAVSEDRSMTALIANDPDRYGYQEGLNRLQRYLTKIRFDWSKRNYIGRTLFTGGYIRLQPDVFSSAVTERLFHVCCSLDFAEAKRAEAVREKLLSGAIENTPHNRRMSKPQFRIVEETNVIHVDFLWSIHCFNPEPFRAVAIYRKVWEEGVLDLLDDEPEMEAVPRTPLPKADWLRIPGSIATRSHDGLSDPLAVMAYFDGEHDARAARAINTPSGKMMVASFAEEDEVMVDEDAASFIIWNEYDQLRQRVESGEFTPCSAAQYYLRYGVVSLAKGKGSLFHRLAQRGQLYQRMGLSDTIPLQTMLADPRHKIMTDHDYRLLAGRKIRGAVKKLRFWTCFALLVDLHIEHQTAVGEWIIRALQQEENVRQDSAVISDKNHMLDGIFSVCNLRLQWVEDHNGLSPATRQYFRYIRQKTLAYIRDCIAAGKKDALYGVMWELRLLAGNKRQATSSVTGFQWLDNELPKPQGLASRMLKSYLRVIIKCHEEANSR